MENGVVLDLQDGRKGKASVVLVVHHEFFLREQIPDYRLIKRSTSANFQSVDEQPNIKRECLRNADFCVHVSACQLKCCANAKMSQVRVYRLQVECPYILELPRMSIHE